MLNFSTILGTTIGNSFYYYLPTTIDILLIVILAGLITLLIIIKFIKTLITTLKQNSDNS